MVKTDWLTSSHVPFGKIEPDKCFILSRIGMFLQEPFRCCWDRFISFGKHCWTEDLRRRNTRYKNPQLVAQHCFVASFCRSTWPATKTFVASWRNAARWLVDLLGHEQICCATRCEFDEKRATKPKFVAQSRPAFYFSQQLSATRNKCFRCATSWSHKVKNGKHRRKLATKQCCATSWGFLYLVFRRL